MSKSLKEINFLDLLPSSISGDEKMKAAALALNAELSYLNDKTDLIFLWSRIDTIEEPLISALAYQMHVDYWDDNFLFDQKREIVKTSIAWHRIKGTRAAVDKMLAFVIGGGVAEDWHEYGGEPFYFRIVTTESLVNQETFEKKLIPAINRAKNTRSWLEEIIVDRDISGDLFFGLGIVQRKKITIGFALNIAPQEDRFIGLALRIGKRITINAA